MPLISVDPESLSADGTSLMDWLTGAPPPTAEPASAHPTSTGVVANLNAQSQALDTYINNGLQKLDEGGAAHVVTAASFRETDDGNTALFGGTGSTSGAIWAPTPVTSVSDPAPTAIPPIPPLAPLTGKDHATAYYTGSGSGSLRALGEYWQAQAVTLDNIGAETSQTGAAVDAHWSDSIQTAGAKPPQRQLVVRDGRPCPRASVGLRGCRRSAGPGGGYDTFSARVHRH